MSYRRPLQGKVALVTGSSRGLGAAIALHLARWGSRVIVTYRRRADAAAGVAAACSEMTPGAEAVQIDLTDEDSVRSGFATAIAGAERLDFLVANAAATALKSFLELKLHQIDKTFAISVRTFRLLVQLGFPLLEKTGGRVIAVSGADRTPAPGIPAHRHV